MNDELSVLKSKTKKIYKSNKLNKANFAEYNLNDYRVYLNTIALIGGVTAQGKYLQPDDITREYTLSAKDFSEQFGIDIKNSYRILKQAANKLMKTDITIEKPELFETWRINVCEMAKYNEKDGTITIEFTQRIMEYLKQRTKNFTLYNLNEVANLTSLSAIRLYELIQQFNTTTGYLIHTIEQWRDIFGITPQFYKSYSDLKRKIFVQAMDEINTKTGYKLVLTEEKEGRKVIRVRFDFTKDEILTGMDTRTGKLSTRHRKQLTAKPLTPEELAKKEARRAKEKEYRDRHKAKKAEKLTHIDHNSDDGNDEPDWDLFKTEDELNSAGVPQNERAVRLTMEELADLKKQWQLEREQEEAKKIINPETKPRKKIFGIF
jgi:plasmid replication initiation protein